MATLIELMRGRVTAIWGLVVAATMLTFMISFDQSISDEIGMILIMVVAFVKVRLIGLYFMELREAPTLLRSVFEIYCSVACAVLIGFYLFA